jgi:hypothetical protein
LDQVEAVGNLLGLRGASARCVGVKSVPITGNQLDPGPSSQPFVGCYRRYANKATGCYSRLAAFVASWRPKTEMKPTRSSPAGVLSAVRNAICEPWSNGQTEGQINRLKMLKRAMYGRASVALLRARMRPLHEIEDHQI